jgi:hypothetical protein
LYRYSTGLVGAEGMRLGMVMFGAESVTLAARLMMKAKFGTALVSADVKAATERHIAYEVGLYRSNAVETHSLKAPGFNPCN